MVGESEASTRKGVAAAVPCVLGALIARGATENGAASLIRLMHEHKIDGSMLDELALLFGGRGQAAQLDIGNSMLNAIAGDKVLGLMLLVGSTSEMPGASAGKLLALVVPVVLGGVATAAPDEGYSPASLAAFLAQQKNYLGPFAPAGLADTLELGVLGETEPPTVVKVRPMAGGTAARETVGAVMTPSFLQLAWPWVLLTALLLLALFGLRSCLSGEAQPPVGEAPVVSEPEPVAAEPAAEPTQITLPSGSVLAVPPGSVGDNLYNFLAGEEAGSKTFLFDGLTFESGRATLDARSQETIAAIAEILKAFGTVTVSVDGYTDNTGSREANLRLSAARAQQVMAALTAAGIDASRMAAAGHADDSPVADNATEEGRAQNRRTELTATKN
jgi:outer membrane protein OmpA-like peptidoglycan-associated protein